MSALSSDSVSVSAAPDGLATQEVALVTAPRFQVPTLRARTLGELHAMLGVIESSENPDAVLPLSDLKVNDEGLVTIPGHGAFALTDWARKQLAGRLGIVWDRWFALLGAAERAAEINMRLARSPERMRLRTAAFIRPDDGQAVPVLRAFVTPSYSPVSDALLVEMLSDVLRTAGGEIEQFAVTDMTVSYTVSVGQPLRPVLDSKVGDLQGRLLVRNSGVGYSGLSVASQLKRLVCLNGMIVPVKDPTLIDCIHRGVDPAKLRATLALRAREIGGAFSQGAERLVLARRYQIDDREAAFKALLSRTRLPKKQLAALEAAYQKEPEASAFGIVQAATRASQHLAPELRYDLERAATSYLLGLRIDD